MSKRLFLGGLVYLLVAPVAARADFVVVPVDDPTAGGSWSQRWQLQSSHLYFDYIYTEMLSPDDAFESPAMSEFSKGAWLLGSEGNTHAWASGDLVKLLLWTQKFAGVLDNSTELTYILHAYQAVTIGGKKYLTPLDAWALITFCATSGKIEDKGRWTVSELDGGWDGHLQPINPPHPILDATTLPIPVPAAVLLGAAGLGLVAAARRLRRW